MANKTFYDVLIITSQVTIVFTKKLMQLIERESWNRKLEILYVEKMKKRNILKVDGKQLA